MKELNEEIKLTINTMQCDIDDGAHGELQNHLYGLLEIKRNELKHRLVERSWAEPVVHDQAKPLTNEDLLACGWWCGDDSERARWAFAVRGFNVAAQWSDTDGCRLAVNDIVTKFVGQGAIKGLRRIELRGNEFYWSEP